MQLNAKTGRTTYQDQLESLQRAAAAGIRVFA